jgi:hypothetical protein
MLTETVQPNFDVTLYLQHKGRQRRDCNNTSASRVDLHSNPFAGLVSRANVGREYFGRCSRDPQGQIHTHFFLHYHNPSLQAY